MMSDHTSEPEEMYALLPWYAKGTLSAAEMRRVEAWLAANPEAQLSLELIREEMAATIEANESLGAPSAKARERLMQAIAAESGAAARMGSAGVWQRVKAAWAHLVPQGLSPGMAFAGAVACLVIVLQAAALTALLLGNQPGRSGIHLAGGEETADKAGTFVIVRFTDEARAADIAALLKPMGATIVDGPKPGSVFKIRVAPKALSDAERAAIIEKLQARRDIVSFVAPAG